jgi:vanillate O-demethylase ferredoxin subunit
MAAVIAAAREHGWPEAAIHREYFTATPVKAAHEVAFEVRIASTGATIPVAPDQTVLAALAAHGIDIPYSCEEGVCGTCLTRVLEGVPDHRDHYLTETEKAANDQFLPCCSRAKSRLLLLDL